MSRAAALKLRLAEKQQAATQTLLTVTIGEARHLRAAVTAIAASAPSAPPAAAAGAPLVSRPGSAAGKGAATAPTSPNPDTTADPNGITSFISFNHLDEHQTYIESQLGTGASPVYGLQSTLPLRVSSSLLTRVSSTPLTLRVFEASTAEAVAAATAAAAAAIPSFRDSSPSPSPMIAPRTIENLSSGMQQLNLADGSDSTTEKRPGLLLGDVRVPLSSLLSGSDVVEGWFPVIAPPSVLPPSSLFAPDPDLGQPELFVPFGIHQSQRPCTPLVETKHATSSARPSAPSTPERSVKRTIAAPSPTNKNKTASTTAAESNATDATIDSTASPPPPMEVFVSIRLSRPLLSAAEASASTTLSLALDRLVSLPPRWLADVTELDAEKERARAEAEAQILAWRKKGAKKAVPPPVAAGKLKPGAGSGAGPAAVTTSAADDKKKSGDKPAVVDKKREKERARELELRGIVERLNSQWRFGISLALPLGPESEDADSPPHVLHIHEQCEELELPPPPPPADSTPTSPNGGDGTLESLNASPSPRPGSSSNSAQNSARKSGGGTSTAGAAGAANAATKAKNKKAEEERLAREAAEAAEQAATKLATRMAARFVPFRIRRDIFVGARGVMALRELALNGSTSGGGGGGVAITLWRELVSIDPSNPGVLQRDELPALARVDLRPLAKPGATSMSTEVAVRLDPTVMARLESNVAAALAAFESSGVREDGSASPSPAPSEGRQISNERRKSASNKKSARGKDGAKGTNAAGTTTSATGRDEISTAASLVPPVDPFLAARTALIVRVEVDKPLVPLVVKPLLSLAQLVPPRVVAPPPRPAPDVELSEEIKTFVQTLANEYEQIAAQLATEEEAVDENGAFGSASSRLASLTDALIYRLNASGSYHALKERLKPVLMKLHREGRRREGLSVPEAKSGRVTFERRVERLYAGMVERLHATLGDLFTPRQHQHAATVTFVPSRPPPLVLVPDQPYEDQVDASGIAMVLRSATHSELQAAIGASGTSKKSASERLAILALEAEMQGDLPRAALLHQRRCTLEYDDEDEGADASNDGRDTVPLADTAAAWYDFACFQTRMRHPIAAVTALRYALSLESTHAASLLALAALSLEPGAQRDLDAAEVLLRAFREQGHHEDTAEGRATYFVLQVLRLEALDEPEQAAIELEQALRAEQTLSTTTSGVDATVTPQQSTFALELGSVAPAVDGAVVAPTPAVAGTPATAVLALPDDFAFAPRLTRAAVDTPLLRVARYLLGVGAVELASSVLERETSETPLKSLALARLASRRLGSRVFDDSDSESRTLVDQAEAHLARAIETAHDAGEVVDAFALRGHLLYQQRRFDEALEAYETYQEWEPTSLDPLLLYRLGVFYLQSEEFARSREAFLQLCSCLPSCGSWLGVGTCSMSLGDVASGESALIQANRFDRSDAEVWARLAICSLRHDRVDLAHRALAQALRLRCTRDDLLRVAGRLDAEKGFLDLAASTLERAVELRDGSSVRIDLAQVYLRQHRIEAAEAQLQRADQLAENEEEHERVRDQYFALQRQLGREVRDDVITQPAYESPNPLDEPNEQAVAAC